MGDKLIDPIPVWMDGRMIGTADRITEDGYYATADGLLNDNGEYVPTNGHDVYAGYDRGADYICFTLFGHLDDKAFLDAKHTEIRDWLVDGDLNAHPTMFALLCEWCDYDRDEVMLNGRLAYYEREGYEPEEMTIADAVRRLELEYGTRAAPAYDSEDGRFDVYEIYGEGETADDYPDGDPYAPVLRIPKCE